MKNNIKNNYRCIVRSTSNVISKTDQYQVSLPPHIWKKMEWKLNENIRVIVDKDNNCLRIIKDD